MSWLRKAVRTVTSAPLEVVKGVGDAASDAVEFVLPTYTKEEYREIKRKRDDND